MMWIQYIAVLVVVTTDMSVGQELFEHSLLASTFPTNILSTNRTHIFTINGEPAEIYRIHSTGGNIDIGSLTLKNRFSVIMSMDVNYERRRLYMCEPMSAAIYGVSDFKWGTLQEMSIRTIHSGITKYNAVKIAVDWVSDNVYWVDPVFRWIAVQSGNLQNVDQSNYKILVHKHLLKPTALAVDPLHGFMFWSDVGSNVKIERSNLIGEDKAVIVSTGLASPDAIDVDLTSSEIYWVDHIRGTVEGANFNGTNRRTVLRMVHSMFTDLVILENIITVSDFTSRGFHLINKQTGEIKKQRLETSEKIIALGLYTPNSQPSKPDLCSGKGCSDLCVNMPYGAQCLCREGYQLNTDDRTCTEVEGQFHRAIVVAGSRSICMMDIRSLATNEHQERTNCFLNITGADISYFDIDMINRKIYYAADMKIYSKIIDDTSIPIQLVALTDTITGLSWNWRDGNIYWSMGQGQGRIQLFSQSTMSTYTILDRDLYNPRELMILPLDRLMIWISGNRNTYKIEKADMDGANRETIVKPASLIRPVSFTIDPTTNTIYWIDLLTIRKKNLDGTNITSLAFDLFTKQRVAVYKNYLIFTEDKFDGSHVKSCNIDDMDVIYSHLAIPEVGTVKCIKALDAHLQPSTKGPCGVLNGGCEHICLSTGETKLCKCEYGFTLDINRKTCSPTAIIDDNFLVVTDLTHDKIYQISLDNGDVSGLRTVEISKPMGIALNQKTKQLIWCDRQNIHRINLNGTGYELLRSFAFNGSYHDRFAIDHSTGNVYYTDATLADGGFVTVLSPDGRHRQLIRIESKVWDIVLDPADGYLFWSDRSVNRAYMDGTSITTIISLNIFLPIGLAIDGQENRLYIADTIFSTIQKCSYGGVCVQIQQSENSFLTDIVLLGKYLFYIDWNKPYITKLNKDDPTDISFLAQNSELGRLAAIVVYRSSPIPYTESPFCSDKNGGCSTFCFPIPWGRVCGCEDGLSLRSDGKTCTNVDSDGTFTEWTVWSSCTVTCGTGTQSRSRDCKYHTRQYSSSGCVGDSNEIQDCNIHPCPIDGGFSEWTMWESCTVTCGTGSQFRSRICTNPVPQYGGSDCVGYSNETKVCDTTLCPIDGGFSDWTEWGLCTVTCRTGNQSKSRTCTNPAPQYKGSDCVGDTTLTQDCNILPCPIDGGLSEWTSWSSCTATCGRGNQSRSRNCTNPVPQYGGNDCVGDSTDTKQCNTHYCPIDGGLSEWTAWEPCTVTCGTGNQSRSRACTNPAPQYGGNDCVENFTDMNQCNMQSCPIDGGFSEWTAWGPCTVTCGTGNQSRSRACTNPAPRYGGNDCVGDSTETHDCNIQPCPIDGGLSEWTPWNSCTVTCGRGNQSRSRNCTNPIPQYGGNDCVGGSVDFKLCNIRSCPIDGGFNTWTPWGPCTVTCGTGNQSKMRACTNPAPQYGGNDCVGNATETQECNIQPCPIDGGFSEWTMWNLCSVTCGIGNQSRSRECVNPTPQYGGNDCVGDSTETKQCSIQPCPIDGGFSEWTAWELCTETCGRGNQFKSRVCTNPAPQYGGSDCVGDSTETQDCNIQPCPIDGGFSEWNIWGSCPVTCGTGSQSRSRVCTNPVPQYGGSDCVGDSNVTESCNTQPCPIDGGFSEWTTWGPCTVTCGNGDQFKSRDCTNPLPQNGGSDCVGDSRETQHCNIQPCPTIPTTTITTTTKSTMSLIKSTTMSTPTTPNGQNKTRKSSEEDPPIAIIVGAVAASGVLIIIITIVIIFLKRCLPNRHGSYDIPVYNRYKEQTHGPLDTIDDHRSESDGYDRIDELKREDAGGVKKGNARKSTSELILQLFPARRKREVSNTDMTPLQEYPTIDMPVSVRDKQRSES